ncbi:restriction endonuclease subunit S [Salmonella enterica]|nr:restriction endonuclease subunit S [Salmonella enterica]ECS8515530.1 restriction endonuclease subunit S [Salmonella enterica subsp. enterica serovar Brandenburg]EAN4999303.1 restriction endonuclease subunit S [Salmonella enterica]EAN4999450.1 restriction endonuclease subunit S [Salmonella enterica]EBH6933509.1 restriction endonuclease subunit S [Salmonella enterica]
MSVDNKVPEIRFKGFCEDWNQRKLDTIFGKIRNAFVGTATPYYVKEGHFYLESNNVKDGKINRKNEIFINDEFYHKQSDKWLREGDIVMVQSGHVGHTAVIPPELNNIAAHALIMFTDPKEEICSHFLNFQFQTDKVKTKLSEITTGNTIKHILSSEMKEFEMFFSDYEEQTQIGSYFQKLDSLISQHQQKHDKLSKFKKSMLKKMFPKQGKTMPEIRFKGFNGTWEEKVLGELAEIVRGASPRPIEDPKWFDSQSSVGWLRIRDVTEQDGRIHYLEQRISKLGQEKTRVLHEKHLLLSIAASVGKPVVNYVETGVHDGFLIFKKPLFELEFMYQWLKSFEAKWQQFGQPGSQVNLNSDIVKSLVVTIPTNEEQTAIGNYFQKLDALIDHHQQQINKLNNIKQSCLSKMFV